MTKLIPEELLRVIEHCVGVAVQKGRAEESNAKHIRLVEIFLETEYGRRSMVNAHQLGEHKLAPKQFCELCVNVQHAKNLEELSGMLPSLEDPSKRETD